jgi:hypothetical protein
MILIKTIFFTYLSMSPDIFKFDLVCRASLLIFFDDELVSRRHGLINSIDNKPKFRHLKKLPVKGLCNRCLSEFIN